MNCKFVIRVNLGLKKNFQEKIGRPGPSAPPPTRPPPPLSGDKLLLDGSVQWHLLTNFM